MAGSVSLPSGSDMCIQNYLWLWELKPSLQDCGRCDHNVFLGPMCWRYINNGVMLVDSSANVNAIREGNKRNSLLLW